MESFQADVVILDLEDSLVANEKAGVRELYVEALKDNLFSNSKVFVRSSALTNIEDVNQDITIFVGSGIEGFLIPKVDTADQILHINQKITAIEKEKNIPLMQTKLFPLIKTVRSYFALDKIALTSRRNIGILGGSGDFTADSICDYNSIHISAR